MDQRNKDKTAELCAVMMYTTSPTSAVHWQTAKAGQT
jgi:hypothetical protein